MFTVMLHWIHAVLCTITLPSILYVLFTYASFSQCDIFSQLLPNWLYNNVYSISLTYTYSTVYNHCPQYTYSTVYNHCPQYTYFDVYIRFPFHNVNIFHTLVYNCLYNNVTYNLLCLHAVMFKITLPSILSVLFTYAYFSQCDIFSQLLPNWLYTTFKLNFTIYIQYCLQLLSPVYLLCCLHMVSFSQCEYFSTHYCKHCLYDNVYK